MASDVDACADIEVEPEIETMFSDDDWVDCNIQVDVEDNAVDLRIWIDIWSVIV